jgi:hypothetical protein
MGRQTQWWKIEGHRATICYKIPGTKKRMETTLTLGTVAKYIAPAVCGLTCIPGTIIACCLCGLRTRLMFVEGRLATLLAEERQAAAQAAAQAAQTPIAIYRPIGSPPAQMMMNSPALYPPAPQLQAPLPSCPPQLPPARYSGMV